MKEIDLDVRIIVASNENLKTAYQAGKFREDLYHRFNEFSINIPPLRDRQDDIPLFAQFFLDKANDELQKDIRGYEPDVVEAFKNYSWPGNLREMRNVVRKSALLETSDMITTATLPSEMLKPAMSAANFDREDDDNDVIIPVNPLNLKSAAGQAEYQAILNVLKKVNFNKTKAAEMLNIDRKTLYNKLKNFELI
jgi:two-component system response regulator HydG